LRPRLAAGLLCNQAHLNVRHKLEQMSSKSDIFYCPIV
jgi:hypothetical protein